MAIIALKIGIKRVAKQVEKAIKTLTFQGKSP